MFQRHSVTAPNHVTVHRKMPSGFFIDMEQQPKQAIFIRKNRDNILQIAEGLYKLMTEDNEEFVSERIRLEKRCCRFKILEEQSKLYRHSSTVYNYERKHLGIIDSLRLALLF